MRIIGPSRYSKAFSHKIAEISPAIPPVRVSSCRMIILLVFHYFIVLVPLPALAALLLVTSISVVNTSQFLLCLKSTRSDALVLAVTIFACIFFSFDIAFYIGVGMSITLYLKKAAIPQLVEFEVDEARLRARLKEVT